jgi:hypothetical protein
VARGQPPEVPPDEYERRLLRVFLETKETERFPGGFIGDAWLEGEHPDTKVIVIITFRDRPGCRYIFRSRIWRSSSDSNPEAQAYEIDVSLQEWTSTMRSIPWTPGMTHDPHPGSAGCTTRRPGLDG